VDREHVSGREGNGFIDPLAALEKEYEAALELLRREMGEPRTRPEVAILEKTAAPMEGDSRPASSKRQLVSVRPSNSCRSPHKEPTRRIEKVEDQLFEGRSRSCI